jgi:hypothetical protein
MARVLTLKQKPMLNAACIDHRSWQRRRGLRHIVPGFTRCVSSRARTAIVPGSGMRMRVGLGGEFVATRFFNEADSECRWRDGGARPDNLRSPRTCAQMDQRLRDDPDDGRVTSSDDVRGGTRVVRELLNSGLGYRVYGLRATRPIGSTGDIGRPSSESRSVSRTFGDAALAPERPG